MGDDVKGRFNQNQSFFGLLLKPYFSHQNSFIEFSLLKTLLLKNDLILDWIELYLGPIFWDWANY
jgi:hypothetical protein